MTVEYPQAAEIARRLKKHSGAPIVVGGAHVNAVGERALAECEAFDYACVGEGEHVVVELADHLGRGADPATIAGLAWRDELGTALRAKPRPYPRSYDELPFPAWDLFRLGNQVPILTHRGCPFRCTFCGHNSGFQPRYRSPANVLAEIDHVVAKYSPEVIRFEDETFGLNSSRTKKILAGILERGLQHRVRFSAQTRVDKIDEQFIDLLRDANFETLELGVESGNAEVLERVQKGIRLDQVERAVGLAKSRGLRVWCKFILGHPHETRATLRDTISFIARLNPDQLSVSIHDAVPGHADLRHGDQGGGGYRLLAGDWQSFDKYSAGVLELEGVSLATLKRLQIWSYAWLYLSNGRVRDLARLVWGHRKMAAELAVGSVRETLRELRARLAPTSAH